MLFMYYLIFSSDRRCWAASRGVWSTSWTRAALAPAAAPTRRPRPWPPWRCRGCGGARRCPACGAPSTAATRTPCAAAGASTASRVSRYNHRITLQSGWQPAAVSPLFIFICTDCVICLSSILKSPCLCTAHLQCTSCALAALDSDRSCRYADGFKIDWHRIIKIRYTSNSYFVAKKEVARYIIQ